MLGLWIIKSKSKSKYLFTWWHSIYTNKVTVCGGMCVRVSKWGTHIGVYLSSYVPKCPYPRGVSWKGCRKRVWRNNTEGQNKIPNCTEENEEQHDIYSFDHTIEIHLVVCWVNTAVILARRAEQTGVGGPSHEVLVDSLYAIVLVFWPRINIDAVSYYSVNGFPQSDW